MKFIFTLLFSATSIGYLIAYSRDNGIFMPEIIKKEFLKCKVESYERFMSTSNKSQLTEELIWCKAFNK